MKVQRTERIWLLWRKEEFSMPGGQCTKVRDGEESRNYSTKGPHIMLKNVDKDRFWIVITSSWPPYKERRCWASGYAQHLSTNLDYWTRLRYLRARDDVFSVILSRASIVAANRKHWMQTFKWLNGSLEIKCPVGSSFSII